MIEQNDCQGDCCWKELTQARGTHTGWRDPHRLEGFTLVAALEHNDTLEMLFLHEEYNPPELPTNKRCSFLEPVFVCFPDLNTYLNALT